MTTNQTELPKINSSEILRTELAIYFTATSGKTKALVAITEDRVQVICINASHLTWKFGAGRFFQTVADAVAAYKKPAMKAIILAADKLNS
jgi:hypothetical protein